MKARILCIEDNEQNLYLVSFLLNSKGYEVLQARDGQEGIELAKRENPDLILLDIQLPSMDGYTVAQSLRTNSNLSKVPIIAVTSYSIVGDREKAIDSGCSGFIEKPINPDKFLMQIEECLLCGVN